MAVLSPSPLGSRFIAPLPQRGVLVEHQLPPQLLEPPRVRSTVADGVLNVAVPEIALEQPLLRALVGESKTAGETQHVGMNGHR